MKTFIEKYKPKSSDEIPQNLKELEVSIKNKENCMAYGRTGSGKTASVYAIADELDLEVIEVNASDFRTKDEIEKIIGNASRQQSLFQKGKLLVIEEADCISGREDRGGASAILSILKESEFPVVITCNDPGNEKLKEIKKQVKLIEFPPVKISEITKILKKIAEKENIKAEEKDIAKIAANSNGDLRAAINDFQSSIIKKELILLLDSREQKSEIVHLLNAALKLKTFEASKSFENTDIELDEYSLWLDENLPLHIQDKNDLLKAYEMLSKADIMKGRIRRQQYWRLMYYQSLLLSSGISVSKSGVSKIPAGYKRPVRLLKIWQANIKNAKKKSIAEKIAKETHTSIKEVIKNFNAYKLMLNNKEILEYLKLNEEETEYLKNH